MYEQASLQIVHVPNLFQFAKKQFCLEYLLWKFKKKILL